MKRCPAPRCPHLIPPTHRYCLHHAREYETKRGTRTQRGYGQAHVRLRGAYAHRLDNGEIIACARCGRPITAKDEWALDHDDNDRSRYLGISHKSCNDSAGGTNAHKHN